MGGTDSELTGWLALVLRRVVADMRAGELSADCQTVAYAASFTGRNYLLGVPARVESEVSALADVALARTAGRPERDQCPE
jgi:hypothetical protein